MKLGRQSRSTERSWSRRRVLSPSPLDLVRSDYVLFRFTQNPDQIFFQRLSQTELQSPDRHNRNDMVSRSDPSSFRFTERPVIPISKSPLFDLNLTSHHTDLHLEVSFLDLHLRSWTPSSLKVLNPSIVLGSVYLTLSLTPRIQLTSCLVFISV